MKAIHITPSLTLRELRLGDETDIFHAIDTGREHLGRWLPFVESTRTVEDSRAFVEAVLAGTEELVFTLRLDNRLIGLVGFKNTAPDNSSAEIGYWMCEKFQGHGYMTAAVRELVRFAFGRNVACDNTFGPDGVGEIFIKCAVGNERSRNIPLRLGFVFRRIEPRGEYVSEGVFRDIEVYSLKR